ncbi:alpha/beta hydrolase [Pendulispora rubella]|uniref:Alpha/beta hydrolase n=1 Tax=Pendulispora rubella TaxID=2741070 RepID=A0ABZ2LP31_9BACT
MAHPGGPGGGWGYLRMPEVEKFATVVYIEPIGTGASARLPNPADYGRERDTATVEGLRAHLGLENVVLLGHSYGGFVALDYALAYPNHLRGLVLYDTAPTTGPDFQKDVEANKKWFENEPWYADATSALSDVRKAESDEELTTTFRRAVPLYVANWTERHKEFEASAPPLLLYLERAQRRKAHGPPADKPSKPFDVRPRLGEIQVPTLILVGQKDFICSEKMANVMHQGIPGSRLVVFERIGHLAHSESPAEHARALRVFLDGVDRAPKQN